MAFGIFGSAQQAGFHQGQNWERNLNRGNEQKAKAVAAEGLGVAIAGIAAVAQARKEAAAHKALAQTLKDALAKVAPNHPLANAQACNDFFKKAYDEA